MPQVLFRAIRAKPINWQAFYDEIARTMDAEVKPALLKYFERVTKSWRHSQTFAAQEKITRDKVSVNVWPTGADAQIWRYVSKGTKGPYWIVSKNPSKYPLKFRTGYKPRTTTSGGYKGPGRAFGKIVRPLYVSHPGIKARNFEKHIARWYAPVFRRTMKNAMARAMRRASRAS